MLRIKSCHTSGNDKREVNHKYVEPILSRELTLTTIPVFLNLPEVTEYPVSVMVSVEGTLDEGSPLPYVTPSDGAPLFDVEVRPGVGVCFPAPAGLLSIGLTCSNSTGVKFKVTVTK